MKSLIITVAGTATRFNRDTKEETLKCLYHKGNPNDCLLSQILLMSDDFDEIIIVGGYLYDKLLDFVNTHLADYLPRIKTVYNPYYREYGSGYSLLLGIQALDSASSEVLFIEGDLYVDQSSFAKIIYSEKDVITVNREPILSNKAVVFYVDESGHLHYIYDTTHRSLFIAEPFTAIYNSGQTWKFVDVPRLHAVVDALSDVQQQGTNLETIMGYFGPMSMSEIDLVCFDTWYNCNTVLDYEKVYKLINSTF